MSDVRISEAHDLGNDVLRVRGTVDGHAVEALGWLSAMANHFDAKHYGDDCHLKRGATGRAMTKGERRAYAERLLLEAAPPETRAVAVEL